MTDPRSHVFEQKQLIDGYRKEMEGLSVIVKSSYLNSNIELFTDYRKKLILESKNSLKEIKKLFKKSRVLDISSLRKEVEWFIYGSHMAMCCSLFSGSKIPFQSVLKNTIDMDVIKMLESRFMLSADAQKNIENDLQGADTVRVSNLLRLMGLLTDKSKKNIYQFSIAAGAGNRDIDAMHFEPEITINNIDSNDNSINLKVHARPPAEVTLVDAGVEFHDHYNELNSRVDHPTKITALNIYLEDALSVVRDKIRSGKISAYNSVIGYRIDHNMFPDVSEFFKSLSYVITDVCDFVITIGAGHDLKEFIGREKTINEMTEWLESRGLEPYRINFCYGNNPEERRKNLIFGLGPIASYEVLYCKLKKKKIS